MLSCGGAGLSALQGSLGTKWVPSREGRVQGRTRTHCVYLSPFDMALGLFLPVDWAFVNTIELQLCSIQLA